MPTPALLPPPPSPITNVNTTHAGDYTCNVTNDAGTDSSTAPLLSIVIK